MGVSRTYRLGLGLAVALGLVSCVLAASFLVRTRPVLGGPTARGIESWAARHGASIHVKSMRPVGLTGIRLDDVHLSVERGGVAARLETEALDVYPSWRALWHGRAAPSQVIVQGGNLDLRRAPRPDDRRPATDTDDASKAKTASSDPDSPRKPPKEPDKPASRNIPSSLQLTARELKVRAELPFVGRRTRPTTLHRVGLTLKRGAGLGLEELRGYGEFPGDTSFSVTTEPGHSAGAEESGAPSFHFDLSRPTSLDDWLGPVGRVDASVEAIDLCPTCKARRACVANATVDGPRDLRFQTAQGCLELSAEQLSVSTSEIEAYQDGRELPYRLDTLRGSAHLDGSRASGTVGLIGHDQGGARLTADWRRPAGTLSVNVEATRFRPGRFLEMADFDRWIRGGIVDGTLAGEWHRDLHLVSFDGDLGYTGGTVEHPLLGKKPLHIDNGRLTFRTSADLSDRALAVEFVKLAPGGSEPVELWGSVVDASPHWSFEFGLEARSVDVPGLRDVLPKTLAYPALGSRLEGSFDLAVRSAGHTGFPDSLMLDVDVGGDVEVMRDGPFADIPSLALTGPPPVDLTTRPLPAPPLERWATLSELPEMVPKTIIAAEDAQFYEHPGFSWRGVRNAMAHNLKVDRLERGGSTITQQLAKNLFLTERRTLTRKFRETWIAWRLEDQLSKDRILELYLNLVKWGTEVRGLEEAARHYFEVSADELTVAQMALLGAILPGPSLYGPWIDQGYLASSRIEKMEHILANLRYLELIDMDTYRDVYEAAKEGDVGGLELTVCRDDEHAPPDAPDCP